MAREKDDRYIPVVVGTNNVPNLQALNEILKQIWISLHQLEGRTGTVTTLSDLVVEGSISTTEGITSVGHIIGLPAGAKWTSTANAAGTGSYVWDTEVVADPDHFELTSGSDGIAILEGGTFLVSAHLMAEDDTNAIEVDITLNGTPVASYHTSVAPTGTSSFSLSTMVEADANDVIAVEMHTGTTRVGGTHSGTQLCIYNLN